MQKGFSIVVLLIVLVAVAVGGYLVFQNQGLIPILPTNPSPSPTIQDETTNWKTYTNTKYFYSLRFPHNWKVSNYEGNTESDLNVNTTHEIKFSPVIQVDNKVPQIRIGVGLGSETTTEEYLKNLDQLKKATSPREVNDTLGRVSAYRTIENSATLGKITTILVAKNRLRYQISSVSPNTDSQDEKIFDQILSTFKFNNQVQPTASSVSTLSPTSKSGWQTYVDEKAGFAIQYPLNSKVDQQIKGEKVTFLSCNSDTCMRRMEMTVYNDYGGGSRRAWFDKKFDVSTYNPYYGELSMVGVNALVVATRDAGSNNDVFVIIPKGNRIYLYTAPGDAIKPTQKPNLSRHEENLSTFKFTD